MYCTLQQVRTRTVVPTCNLLHSNRSSLMKSSEDTVINVEAILILAGVFSLMYFSQDYFVCRHSISTVSEDAGIEPSARNYRPCFRENQPKRSFSIKWKRAFWARFRENWVYKFGHSTVAILELAVTRSNHWARSHLILILFSTVHCTVYKYMLPFT